MSVIQCNGGVDLMSPRVAARPGSLRDCLNYEVDTEIGYRSIQGFARYDGRAYPVREPTLKKYTFTSVSGTFQVGETLSSDGVPFAIFRKLDGSNYILDIFGDTPASDAPVLGNVSGATATRGIEVSDATLSPSTAAQWLTLYEDHASAQRSAVEWAGGRLVGTHYFRDKAWVIREPDIIAYTLSGFPAANATGGTLQPLAVGSKVAVQDAEENLDIPTFFLSNYLGEITYFEVVSGDYSAGTATVRVAIKWLGEVPRTVTGTPVPDTGRNKVIKINDLEVVEFSTGNTLPATNDLFTSGSVDGEFYIDRIILESGSWSGGDAAGTLWIRATGAETTELGSFTGGTSGSTLTLTRIVSGTGLEYSTPASYADIGRYGNLDASQVLKDTGAGWEEVDTGHEVQFDTGKNEPETVFDLTIAQIDTSVAATASSYVQPADFKELNDGQSFPWENSASSTTPADIAAAVDTSGDSDFAELTPSGNNRLMKSGIWKDLGFSIADNQTIVGVEAQVRLRNQNNDIEWYEARLVLPDGTESTNKASIGTALGSALVTETFGAEGDNWSLSLTPDIVNDPEFGIRLKFRAGSVITSAKVEIDLIQVRVYTKPATETVYFYDGSSDVANAELVYVQRLSGAWADNDAVGVATVRNIQSGTIRAGLTVYTGASGTGTELFTTTSAAEKNKLPGVAELRAAESRYLFIDENFYARDSLRMVFGVSGAGLAFAFNDDFFFRIRTGFADENDDKPRHVTRHGERLCLGYQSGELIFSGAAEPANFESTAGTSVAVGSSVHGLVEMTGSTLAILCKDNVQILQGTDPAAWALSRLDSESGCIEYTAVNMGSPIYLDSRGVSSIQVTDSYGDFQRGRMSYRVEPWLRPRIQRLLSGRGDAGKPVAAIPIRAKSQYLLFFADGYALSMTMMDDGPQFMFRRYLVDGLPLDVLALGEGKTSTGQDRVFMSHADSGFVYELNRGFSFDGDGIPLDLTFNSVWMATNWRGLVCHLFGDVYDQGTLSTYTISDFSHEVQQDRVILRSDSENHLDDRTGFYEQIRAKTRGVNIALRLARSAEVKPEHIIQAYQWARPTSGREER